MALRLSSLLSIDLDPETSISKLEITNVCLPKRFQEVSLQKSKLVSELPKDDLLELNLPEPEKAKELSNPDQTTVNQSNLENISSWTGLADDIHSLNQDVTQTHEFEFLFINEDTAEKNTMELNNHPSFIQNNNQPLAPQDKGNFNTESNEIDISEFHDNSDVLQRKLDEDELRRQVDKLKRQADIQNREQIEKIRLAEERWKAEIEERIRLEEEARQLRLREIEDQEQVEASRRAEEDKILAKQLHEEIFAKTNRGPIKSNDKEEDNKENIEVVNDNRKQEEEEKTAVEGSTSDDILRIGNLITVSELKLDDECHCYDDYNFQDFEEKPESPDADDDTQIEEEAGCTQAEDVEEDHFCDGEHEGFNDICIDNILNSTIETE